VALIFLVELFFDGCYLPMFEFSDCDRAPALGSADRHTEHQLQDGSLAKRIRDDLEAVAFLDEQALEQIRYRHEILGADVLLRLLKLAVNFDDKNPTLHL
jgi:hypothetical protein